MAPAGMYDEDDLFDDDDYEDEQEEELSPEDRAAMEKGTVDVKMSLGANASRVTVKQIQEALWHYYYDVDKSVAYLSKTFIAPPANSKPKKAPESKLNEFSFSSTFGLFVRRTGPELKFPWTGMAQALDATPSFPHTCPSRTQKTPVEGAFDDMPWLNTPSSRHGTFVAPPRPQGGLLGGAEEAPKMSKLQALAAARKKKVSDKKEQAKATQSESVLKRLSIADESPKDMVEAIPSPSKRHRGPDASPPCPPSISDDIAATEEQRTFEGSGVKDSHAKTVEKTTGDLKLLLDGMEEHHIGGTNIVEPTPSAFAKAMFRSTPDSRRANRPEFFALPYVSSSSFMTTAFAEPSPDDVVLAARAKAGGKAGKPTGKKPVPGTGAVASPAIKTQKNDATGTKSDFLNDVFSLKVSDVPTPKSKGLDVIKEYEANENKKSISFVVVGHVDAGKSTLMGRLLLELKYVQERTVEKYRRQAEKSGKQSFALAWVMDQGTEERERGVTIDIATNHFETPRTKFTILDAPGHRDFVPNMIAGASQADIAILVIDANTGAYEKGIKGQTREHVLLLRSLGVQRLIVAVNKLDMIEWSQNRFDEISQQVLGFLTGLGFQSKLVSFIPISGLNGDNIASRSRDASAAWYKGLTLIEALEESQPSSARALTGPFRMSISEIFRSQQQGTTTLSGRIDSGTVQIGDATLVQPSGESAYIKSIMVDAETRDWAVAGQSVSLALTDIDPIHIRVGDILCGVADPIGVGDTFTMRAMAFEHLMPMPIDLHRGRLHAAGRILSIPASLDKATGNVVKKNPKVLQPGGVARVVVQLTSRVPLEKGQRVVLRSGGETIAAGLLE